MTCLIEVAIEYPGMASDEWYSPHTKNYVWVVGAGVNAVKQAPGFGLPPNGTRFDEVDLTLRVRQAREYGHWHSSLGE